MGTGNDHPHGGLELGYALVYATGPSIDRQLVALAAAGIPGERIHVGKKTGTTLDRDALSRLPADARRGDTIVVHALDRNLRQVKTADEGVNRIAFLGIAAAGTGIRKISPHRYLAGSEAAR